MVVYDLPLTVPKRVDKGVLRIDLVGNEGGQAVVPAVEEVSDLVLGDERGNADALWHDGGVVMGDLMSWVQPLPMQMLPVCPSSSSGGR